MKNIKFVLLIGFLLFSFSPGLGQKIETKDGVRIVHNEKDGIWGSRPKIRLEFIRKIGDVDAEDENFAFNYPKDIVEDKDGNLFIADSWNFRILKFDKDGKFLARIGRQGQGPGEFSSISALDIDSQNRIHVLDDWQRKIHILSQEGKEIKNVLIRKNPIHNLRLLTEGRYLVSFSSDDVFRMLLGIVDENENMIKEFCAPVNYGAAATTGPANGNAFVAGGNGTIAVAFRLQNRIEKYSSAGTLLWKADRHLNFDTKVIEQGKIEKTAASTMYRGPKMNSCSNGVAIDGRGRIWVAVFRRQIKPEEIISIMRSFGPSGASMKRTGNTDLRTTDMYQLDVFDPEGVLLGRIPVSQFVDGIWIYGDRLYLLDRDRGVTYYQYRIVETGGGN